MPIKIPSETTIGLAQITSLNGHIFLPLSVGLLQAYYQHHGKYAYTFLKPLVERIEPHVAAEYFTGCAAVLFSVYVWNEQISLATARAIRQSSPETLIIFGGPQVPIASEAYLRAHPYVDILCVGEGEEVARIILDTLPERDWSATLSTRYLKAGQYVERPLAPPLTSLEDNPSPYLNGQFEALMQSRPDISWMALWETNRGCPNLCAYCGWDSTGRHRVIPFPMQRVLQELQWLHKHDIKYVFICDAGFGILDRDVDIAEHIIRLNKRRDTKLPFGLNSTNLKQQFLKILPCLKEMVKMGIIPHVGIDMQSMYHDTKKAIKRKNISLDTYVDCVAECNKDNIPVSTNLILPLPYETYETFTTGIETCIKANLHTRLIAFTLVLLSNAPLESPAQRKLYDLESVQTEVGCYPGSPFANPIAIECATLCVGTAAMTRHQWIRARVFAWMMGVIFFNRVAQIPMMVAHKRHGIPYSRCCEAVLDADAVRFPVTHTWVRFLFDEAQRIASGGHDFINTPDIYGLGWFHEQYVHLRMGMAGELPLFAEELGIIIQEVCRTSGIAGAGIVEVCDAATLNKALLVLPEHQDNVKLTLASDVWNFYRALLRNETRPFCQQTVTLHIKHSDTHLTKHDFTVLVRDGISNSAAFLRGDVSYLS